VDRQDRVKIALRPQAQQPLTHRASPGNKVDDDRAVIDVWKRVAARCPHTEATAVRDWLKSQPVFNGRLIRQVIEKTDVLNRKMPEDFIDAIFIADSPARAALEQVLRSYPQNEEIKRIPEGEALVIKSKTVTASVRPVRDGIFIAISVPSKSGSPGSAKTKICHVKSDEPLPEEVVTALGASIFTGDRHL
jgi:hypothetical protein